MSILKGKASDGIEKVSKEKKSKSKDLKQVPNGKADSVGKNKKDKKEKVKKMPPAKQPSSSEVSVFPCLTPVLQMEVGCSRIWRLTPTTQTQVGGTPHKPALPATQPRAPSATQDPKSSTRHTEQ